MHIINLAIMYSSIGLKSFLIKSKNTNNDYRLVSLMPKLGATVLREKQLLQGHLFNKSKPSLTKRKRYEVSINIQAKLFLEVPTQ